MLNKATLGKGPAQTVSWLEELLQDAFVDEAGVTVDLEFINYNNQESFDTFFKQWPEAKDYKDAAGNTVSWWPAKYTNAYISADNKYQAASENDEHYYRPALTVVFGEMPA